MNNLLTKMIWIESNVNYILNILKILDNAIHIFSNDNNILYNKIEKLLNENKIKYIANKRKSQEHTTEVNECYYILLASICYIITSDELELTMSTSGKNNDSIEKNHYYYILSDVYKILQNLNNDLYIFLKEMYIIDELIKIIELFTKKKNIEKINAIKK